MTDTILIDSQQIAHLNDRFRRTLLGGRVLLTAGISSLPENDQQAILAQVQAFNAFNTHNDPYGEHDFGCFAYQNQRIFWKMDYYDPTLTYGSDNPADPDCTIRVLTVMLAEEY